MNPLNNYRGQVAVFYALLVPVFLFLGGVGLDLGWYYLNVSRLQNAADAAVLVGANKLIETNTAAFKDYKAKLVDKFPADKPETTTTISTTAGDQAALEYAKKNLEGDSTAYAPPKLFSVAQAAEFKDGYTRGNNTVTLTPSLYKDDKDNYYYVLHLTENIHHFFIGFLDDMEAPVVAVALISKNIDDSGGDGDSSVDDIEITFNPRGGIFNDGSSADVIKTYKDPATLTEEDDPQLITTDKGKPTRSDGNFVGWSYTNPSEVANYTKINIYYEGDTLTEERLKKIKENGGVLYAVYDPIDKVIPHNNKTLWEQMQYLIAKNVYNDYWYASKNKYGKDPNYSQFSTLKTYKNGSSIAYYTETATPTSNGIDFSKTERCYIDFQAKWFINPSGRRAHSLFNVNAAYEVRSSHKDKDDDPIYFRIEAEPYGASSGYHTDIRQIVININKSNLEDKYRPLFFYYDGPDAAARNNDNAPSEPNPEDAQPVILNLNADFKGVLWMPDIPVVINGNGNKFEGFIVAKEYRYLDTSRGLQVQYSSKGQTNTTYPDNKIHVNPNTGDVYSIPATGDDAIKMYDNNALDANKFNLHSDSKFRTFHADSGVEYMYVYYGYDTNVTMDETPFHEYCDLSKPLIPLYKLVNGKEVRITKWDDVNLYDKPRTDSTRRLIPKNLSGDNNKGTVRLTNGSPSPLYDEAGNPIYFCEDYVRLTGTYEVLTLDRVADGTRYPKEFLLTKTDNLNVSDTDDWK